MRSKINNLWRTIPFFHSSEYISLIERIDKLIILKNSVELPDFRIGSRLEYDIENINSASFIIMFIQSFGIPGGSAEIVAESFTKFVLNNLNK